MIEKLIMLLDKLIVLIPLSCLSVILIYFSYQDHVTAYRVIGWVLVWFSVFGWAARQENKNKE